MVRLIIPPDMTPETARQELKRCITFGSPEIQSMYVMEGVKES